VASPQQRQPAIIARNADAGDELLHIPLDAEREYSRLTVSPDGRVLAVVASAGPSSGGEVIVYDAGSGKELRRLQGHGGAIAAVAFSGDGKRIATSAGVTPSSGGVFFVRSNVMAHWGSGTLGGETKLWDAATGHELLALAGGFEALALSDRALREEIRPGSTTGPGAGWNAEPLLPQVEAEDFVECLLGSREKGRQPTREELLSAVENDPSLSDAVREAAREIARGTRAESAN
jgi:hypothetical protein